AAQHLGQPLLLRRTEPVETRPVTDPRRRADRRRRHRTPATTRRMLPPSTSGRSASDTARLGLVSSTPGCCRGNSDPKTPRSAPGVPPPPLTPWSNPPEVSRSTFALDAIS